MTFLKLSIAVPTSRVRQLQRNERELCLTMEILKKYHSSIVCQSALNIVRKEILTLSSGPSRSRRALVSRLRLLRYVLGPSSTATDSNFNPYLKERGTFVYSCHSIRIMLDWMIRDLKQRSVTSLPAGYFPLRRQLAKFIRAALRKTSCDPRRA